MPDFKIIITNCKDYIYEIKNTAKIYMSGFNIFTMTNRLLPQVKLPYKYIQGSIYDRQRKSAQLADYFYRNIKGRFKNGEISIDKIQNCVDEVMPSHTRILVRNFISCIDDDAEAFSDTLYSSGSGKINVLTIELPTVNNKITIQDLPALMHEFRHITDQLFHPKILARNQELAVKKMCTDKYVDIYDTYIYNYEEPQSQKEAKIILKRMELVIKGFLRKMSPEDKINYLQDSRYCLMLENNGYQTQQKYAKKLDKQHIEVREDDLIKQHKDFMFSEKIKVLNDMLLSVVQKERVKHRSKLLHKRKNSA